MTLNRLLALGLALGLLGWWFSDRPLFGRSEALPPAVQGATGCALPPAIRRAGAPLQTDVPGGMKPFVLGDSTLTPLAGFSLDARVLSRRDYSSGREADYSPVDLALGWDGMSRSEVLDRLDISQSGRWYHYRWQGEAPLPPGEIIRSSANMHMIPSSSEVARALAAVKHGQQVRLDGWLVEVNAKDGWRWRSSTRRDDTGGGACEVIYVCAVASR